jgi:hypothetical protein
MRADRATCTDVVPGTDTVHWYLALVTGAAARALLGSAKVVDIPAGREVQGSDRDMVIRLILMIRVLFTCPHRVRDFRR